MHSGVVQNSEDAMLYYGTRRTKDGKGVTIASQRRYVRYYEEVLKRYGGEAPPPRLLKMTKLRVHTVPNFSGKPFVSIIIKGREVCVTKAVEVSKKAESFEIEVDYPVFDDVKVQLCARKSKKKHQKMCHFWFSTAFVPEDTNSLTLEKFEIDVANKDKKCAHFKENFKIEAFFEPVDEPKKTPKKTRKSDKKSKSDSKSSGKISSEESENKQGSKKVINNEKTVDSFKTKRKRAQSFYDIEEDEELSDSEKDEREMEKYFEEEEDEDAEESIKLKNSSSIVISESKKELNEEENTSNSEEKKDNSEDKKDNSEDKTSNENEEDKVEEENKIEEEEEPVLTDEVVSKEKSGKKDKKEKSKDKKKDKESKQKKKSDKKVSKKRLK